MQATEGSLYLIPSAAGSHRIVLSSGLKYSGFHLRTGTAAVWKRPKRGRSDTRKDRWKAVAVIQGEPMVPEPRCSPDRGEDSSLEVQGSDLGGNFTAQVRKKS